MRIGVLETGLVPEDLRRSHGAYPDMMAAWLGGLLPQAEFVTVSVVAGEALPPATAYDSYIVTGSRHGVYEDHPWLPPLRTFLREAAAIRRPLLGICFGHQLLAQTFGGTVVKSEKGWGLGVTDYRLTRPVPGLSDPLAALAVHQDQVVALPPGATVLASNAHCPYAALSYDFPAFSVQFHPEFRHAFLADLIAQRTPEVFDARLAEAATASLSRRADSDAVGRISAQFLKEGRLPG